MMKSTVAWIAIGIATALPLAWQEPVDLCHGFVEENDMSIPVPTGFAPVTGLDEAAFNAVLDRVEAIYRPIVESKGGVLKVNRRWTDPTVNASAQQFGNQYWINMYGGLARHPAITTDAFALVACHELGHHLGGAPKMSSIFSWWASNEGQADYFAALKCLRRYFDDESNEAWYNANKNNIPIEAIDQCGQTFTEDAQALYCIRSTMAGLSVGALFQDLRSEQNPPLLSTPDPTVVTKTDDRHPGTQCRVDTYFHGALCDRPLDEQLSDKDYRVGACARVDGYTKGVRPLCWFKP